MIVREKRKDPRKAVRPEKKRKDPRQIGKAPEKAERPEKKRKDPRKASYLLMLWLYLAGGTVGSDK